MSYDVINIVFNRRQSHYCYSLGSNCPPYFSFYISLFSRGKKKDRICLPDAVVIFEDDTSGTFLMWDFARKTTTVMQEDGSVEICPDMMYWVDPENEERLRSLAGRSTVSIKALWRASKQRIIY
jgi:hypothetical protein